MSEPLRIAACDGCRLGATLYLPPAANGRAVLVNSAAGVKQTYYAKFAGYLAGRGFTVLTYDYRGIGESRPRSLRGFAARMSDWIGADAAGALAALEAAAPGARRLAIGHSIGGHAIGYGLSGALDAALTVGSQNAYWKHWSGTQRAGVWFMVHAGLPLLARLFGYFPSRLLGQGEDLPMAATVEWAGWCRHPRYLVGALGVERSYARFAAPLRAYAISDDGLAPQRAVAALLELFPSAKSELRSVTPQEVGAEAIGHFGFFRERFRDTLWREAADWLERQ